MPQKGAPSLYDASKRQALRIMKNIDDLGDMPFSVAEPLLKKVQNAAHLHRIEINCPQYVGETRGIWINLIKRDIPQWNELEPKNPASWYKLYTKLVAAETKATAEDALILKARLDKLAAEKGDRQILTTDLLHKSQVRGSRSAKRAQSADQSSLRFNNGSRTKMVTGRDVVARAKREARERSQALNTHSILAQPTHKLHQRATLVQHAPASLVQQHQTANSSPARIIRKSIESDDSPRKISQGEREARLRAIKEDEKPDQGRSQPTRTSSVSVQQVSSKAALKRPPTAPASKRKAENMEDLFGDQSGNEAKEPSSSPPAKRRLITPPAPVQNHSKRPPASIFVPKPPRKPIRR